MRTEMELEVLERRAVAMMRQYRWLLPAPALVFFRDLAAHLSWTNLQKELK